MSLDKKLELMNLLHQLNVVQKGTFSLTSGKISNFYLDIKLALGNPLALILMRDLLVEKFSEKTSCVVACGYGGIALASAISTNYNLPLSMVRAEERTHGMKKAIEGYIPNPSDVCAFIDDVFSTGKSINLLADKIQLTSAKISGAYVVVNRTDLNNSEKNIPFSLYSLFSIKDLV
ncbi:hypothetical protein J4474_03950 [Candidatus Pacearchaeota archaeon]|nr:hypothetical protein [Candidatus Pacearchaeota archaeon]